jgi:vacuolar-type H+-ATPase subunit H
MLPLILAGIALAQENGPILDIFGSDTAPGPNKKDTDTQACLPVVDIEKISRQIATNPAYERARQLTEGFEDELNRRVQAIVDEKRASISALNQEILRQTLEPSASKQAGNKDHDAIFNEQSRIFIFVSRTVPLEVLKAYAADMDNLGDSNVRLVFRAFPKNFLDSVLRKSPNCTTNDCVVKARIIISKRIFKRYGINQVPAVVYDPDPANKTHATWLKVSGAAPLKKILSLFYRDVGREVFKIAARRVARK